MVDVKSVAADAEKVLETVMKVEPTIVGVSSMLVPGAGLVLAMVQPWVLTVVPFVEKALNDIASGSGQNAFEAFVELLQHISKGGPNSPTLSIGPVGPGPSSSTVGSG